MWTPVLGRFGMQRHEVPECIVSTLCLWNLSVRVGFGSADDIGELQRVLDEEHRKIVAHEIKHSFGGAELRGEASCVSSDIG